MTEIYQPSKNSETSKTANAWKIIIFIIFLLAICFAAWYFLFRENSKPVAPQNANNTQTPQSLLEKISKHIILPAEDPIISTVTDAQKLQKEDAFFSNVQNGDTLLIFPNTKKAILYSSRRDVLVNVGPVILPPGQAEAALNVKIEMRNGTPDLKAADTLMEELKARGATISRVVFAARRDYKNTVLVNVSGADISALENFLGLKAIASLPAGEKPAKDAQAVIIFGK